MRAILAFALSIAAGYAAAANHALSLESELVERLNALPIGASAVIDGFPDGFGGQTAVNFRRIDVYAPGARVVAIGNGIEQELQPSDRAQFLGSDDSGAVHVHLAFDPGFSDVTGSGSSPAGNFVLSANGHKLVATPSEEALPPDVTLQELGTDDAVANPYATPEPLLILAAGTTAAVPVSAVVAVDVDRELLVNRFGGTGSGNVAAANNWIADLFGTMNVMYQRDLKVTLQLGTVILRTSATPYTIKPDAAADGADLDNFGNYWEANHGNVPRSFAMLLSGRMSSGNSASGIAWVKSYCRKQGYGGSYSVNKVFTNPSIHLDASARIVGHELGHNFGASHTHCSSASTGQAPVSTGTIDQCFKGASGCWNGPVSCPASGAGTVMSYCHTGAPSGANCGANVQQFHPTHIGQLSTYIVQNTPSCLTPTGGDRIFRNGFD